RASCVGRAMRTATSASRRSRSSLRSDSASSRTIPGCCARRSASSRGSTQVPTISLAVMRTVPRAASRSPEAVRSSDSAATSIARACGTSDSASGVDASPWRERVNSGAPSPASSASTCRPTVGCVSANARAAADRLPVSSTVRKLRQWSQLCTALFIHFCMDQKQDSAIFNQQKPAYRAGHRSTTNRRNLMHLLWWAALALAVAAAALVFAPRAELVTRTTIAASRDQVWAWLGRPASYRDWNPFLVSMEGELVEGRRIVNVMHPARGRPMRFAPTVLRAEPARELRWLGRLGLPRLFDGEH